MDNLLWASGADAFWRTLQEIHGVSEPLVSVDALKQLLMERLTEAKSTLPAGAGAAPFLSVLNDTNAVSAFLDTYGAPATATTRPC